MDGRSADQHPLLKEHTRRPDAMTDLDAVVVRDGKNIRGRLLGFVLGIFGERVLGKELAKTVKVIDARNSGSRAAKLA